MLGGENLERPFTIQLDGREYRLLTDALAQKVVANGGPKRWKATAKKVAQARLPRPGVQPGEIENEYVLILDDWSKGVGGIGETRAGRLILADQMNGFVPGTLRANPAEYHIVSGTAYLDPLAETTICIVFNGDLNIISGRYLS